MPTPESAMPESFAHDTILPPKLDIAGARSYLFLPPQTPSATSSLHRSIALNNSSVNYTGGSRKRPRYDCAEDLSTPQYDSRNEWSDLASGQSSVAYSNDVASPALFVNTKYHLAGGLDTPTAATVAALEKRDLGVDGPEIDYRQNRYQTSQRRFADHEADGYFPHTPAAQAREGNGRKRAYRSPLAREGWGKAVFNMMGDVAGKVWGFCWSGAFRGFYAGGGRGYKMQSTTAMQSVDQSMWQTVSEVDDIFHRNYRGHTPLPGEFPEDDFIPDYLSRDSTALQAGNGAREEEYGGELRSNWVMVRDGSTSREGSPSHSSRKVPRGSSHIRRPVGSGRKSVTSKTAKRPVLAPTRPSLTSYAGSPALHSTRPASFASPRSSTATPTKAMNSPVSKEAQRYAAKVKKREREEDASIRRLNQQLKAMIQKGKEALGTGVEVEESLDSDDEMLDEGYSEGDMLAGKGPLEW